MTRIMLLGTALISGCYHVGMGDAYQKEQAALRRQEADNVRYQAEKDAEVAKQAAREEEARKFHEAEANDPCGQAAGQRARDSLEAKTVPEIRTGLDWFKGCKLELDDWLVEKAEKRIAAIERPACLKDPACAQKLKESERAEAEAFLCDRTNGVAATKAAIAEDKKSAARAGVMDLQYRNTLRERLDMWEEDLQNGAVQYRDDFGKPFNAKTACK